jgi:hypothetical protein
MVRCPYCRRFTPDGAFCAHCGRQLSSGRLAEDIVADEPEQAIDPYTRDSGDADTETEARYAAGEDFAVLPPLDDEEDDPYDEDEPYGETADLTGSAYVDDGGEPPADVDAEPIDEPPPDEESIDEPGEQDDAAARSSRLPVPQAKRLRGSLARAVSIGGQEGDPIQEALERRGRRSIGDYRKMLALAALAVLISLLLNNAGIAILLSVFVVPALALLYLTDLDLFEREPWSAILGSLGAGFVIGLVFGTISAWLTGQLWIEGATFYAGAAGYAARFAEAEGSPPIAWVALGGVIIPAIVVIACAIAPVLMRRWPVLRNEVMDGLTLGAAAGGGYAAATTIVHFWPAILRDQNPGGDISDWTATLVGLIVFRPLIFAAFAALLCSAIWQYALDQRSSSLIRGVVSGIGGIIIYSVIDLLIQPAGAAAEMIWQLTVLGVLWFVVRAAIRSALAQDAIAFGQAGDRIRCQNCQQLTPDGAYCAHCGAPLYPAPGRTRATVETSLPRGE